MAAAATRAVTAREAADDLATAGWTGEATAMGRRAWAVGARARAVQALGLVAVVKARAVTGRAAAVAVVRVRDSATEVEHWVVARKPPLLQPPHSPRPRP